MGICDRQNFVCPGLAKTRKGLSQKLDPEVKVRREFLSSRASISRLENGLSGCQETFSSLLFDFLGCLRLLVFASGQQQVNTNWLGAAYRAKRGGRRTETFFPTAPLWSRPFPPPSPPRFSLRPPIFPSIWPIHWRRRRLAAAGAGVYRNFAAIVGKGVGWGF